MKGGSRAREWVIFTLVCIIFAFGPDFKVFGAHYLRLPFSLFSYIPGLQAMRTPGRIMLLGYIGLGISAGFGLSWLQTRLGNRSGYRWSWFREAIPCSCFLQPVRKKHAPRPNQAACACGSIGSMYKPRCNLLQPAQLHKFRLQSNRFRLDQVIL